MSIESAKAFLEKVQNDEDFRKELEEQASAEERLNIAKAQGFDFTKEEINAVRKLSDEELEGVTGGAKGDVIEVADGPYCRTHGFHMLGGK